MGEDGNTEGAEYDFGVYMKRAREVVKVDLTVQSRLHVGSTIIYTVTYRANQPIEG